MLRQSQVKELCNELCHENIAITLMTVESWVAGCKACLYKNLGLHYKI
jgi:hypothetical protein